jgi:hypothetical protein
MASISRGSQLRPRSETTKPKKVQEAAANLHLVGESFKSASLKA